MANISRFASKDKVKVNYRIWQTLRGQGIKIYFDTADVIDLLIGMRAMLPIPGEGFRWHLYKDPKQLVYAVAYKGWLGEIRLLPPHLSELYDKLKNETFQRINKLADVNSAEKEFWANKDILSKKVLNLVKYPDNYKKEQMEEFVKQSPHILQGTYLLDRNADWKNRYAYLRKSKILYYTDDSSFEPSELTQTPLFKAFHAALNGTRDSTANNYIDALALCMYDQMLEQAEINNEVPPFFYAEQNRIYRTVKQVSEDPALVKNGRRPFHFKDEKSGFSYMAVRQADFFFFYAILQVSSTHFTELWTPLEKHLEAIANEKDEKVLLYGKTNKDNTQLRLFFLEFFETWWKKEGLEGLKCPFPELTDEEQVSLKEDVEDYIQQEFRALDRSIRFKPEVLTVIRHTLRGLTNAMEDFRDLYARPSSMYAAHEFGSRFSFSEAVCEDIQNLYDDLQSAIKSEDAKTEVDNIKTTIVYYISEALTNIRKRDNLKVLNQLASALGILWLLSKYELIDKVCTAIRGLPHLVDNREDKYPSPPFAIMHLAALLSLRNPRVNKAIRTVKCVESKYKLNQGLENYRVWQALSYAYYRLAGCLFDRIYHPPEDLDRRELSSTNRTIAIGYMKNTLKYAQVAYEYLEEQRLNGTDFSKRAQHLRFRHSAINNIVFCQTILLPENQLKENLQPMVDEQERVSKDSELWHEDRYSDTIARYYYRLARIYEDNEKYLKKTRNYNKRSIESDGLSEEKVPRQLEASLEYYFPR